MLSIIEGTPRPFWGRWPITKNHLARLREEFAGKPEACFQVVKQIVYLRRNIDQEKSWHRFKELVETYIDLYVKHLDTRWLVSICDTYADFGTPLERSNAILISTLVNMTKICETLRVVCVDPEFDLHKVKTQKRAPLWDGMSTYLVKAGNMTRNLFSRISIVVKSTPVLEKIWIRIFEKLQTDDTVLKQLNELHRGRSFFHRK